MSKRWTYEIQVESHLGISWSTWFGGLSIHHREDGKTVLTGTMDQAALHGALAKIRDLGLPLLSVVCIREKRSDHENGRVQ